MKIGTAISSFLRSSIFLCSGVARVVATNGSPPLAVGTGGVSVAVAVAFSLSVICTVRKYFSMARSTMVPKLGCFDNIDSLSRSENSICSYMISIASCLLSQSFNFNISLTFGSACCTTVVYIYCCMYRLRYSAYAFI